MNGNEDTDFLAGDEGDDIVEIRGEGGWDVANGGGGIDTVQYGLRTDSLNLSPDDQFNDGGADERDSVGSDVDRLTGGGGGAVLRTHKFRVGQTVLFTSSPYHAPWRERDVQGGEAAAV